MTSAGLGFALSYTPAVAMVGTYFSERKALAYGVAMSGGDNIAHLLLTFPRFASSGLFNEFLVGRCAGSGIGTFVLAPAVQLLIERYSWRGALLVLGGLVSNLCVCGALMRPLEPSAPPR